MVELTIKFETEADKEQFVSDVKEAAKYPEVFRNMNANNLEVVGDTLFFTRQPETEVVSSEPESLGFPVASEVVEVHENEEDSNDEVSSLPAPIDLENFGVEEFNNPEPFEEVV